MANITVINFQVLTIMNTEPNSQTIQDQESINQIEIRKPVKKLEKISVTKQVYNTLRSFVESSNKETYEWNIGVWISRDTVLFEKRPKWKLYIYSDGNFKLYSWKDNLIMDMAKKVENDRLMVYINIYGNNTLSFDVYNENELRTKAIITNMPFAGPIRLIEIINKLCEYAKFEFCY